VLAAPRDALERGEAIADPPPARPGLEPLPGRHVFVGASC